jgi:hypothetical protein
MRLDRLGHINLPETVISGGNVYREEFFKEEPVWFWERLGDQQILS